MYLFDSIIYYILYIAFKVKDTQSTPYSISVIAMRFPSTLLCIVIIIIIHIKKLNCMYLRQSKTKKKKTMVQKVNINLLPFISVIIILCIYLRYFIYIYSHYVLVSKVNQQVSFLFAESITNEMYGTERITYS